MEFDSGVGPTCISYILNNDFFFSERFLTRLKMEIKDEFKQRVTIKQETEEIDFKQECKEDIKSHKCFQVGSSIPIDIFNLPWKKNSEQCMKPSAKNLHDLWGDLGLEEYLNYKDQFNPIIQPPPSFLPNSSNYKNHFPIADNECPFKNIENQVPVIDSKNLAHVANIDNQVPVIDSKNLAYISFIIRAWAGKLLEQKFETLTALASYLVTEFYYVDDRVETVISSAENSEELLLNPATQLAREEIFQEDDMIHKYKKHKSSMNLDIWYGKAFSKNKKEERSCETPLMNCPHCQLRFHKIETLEKHLLDGHGLVAANVQEAANNDLDSGTCKICKKVIFIICNEKTVITIFLGY